MFVVAESAATIVRLDGRFDGAQARALEEIFSTFRPLRNVVIDFRNLRDVDPAAVASLARTLAGASESRVTFRGLTRHLRRVLRYVGANVDGEGAADRGTSA
jgi:anti-anti-sigma regulatory factor